MILGILDFMRLAYKYCMGILFDSDN